MSAADCLAASPRPAPVESHEDVWAALLERDDDLRTAGRAAEAASVLVDAPELLGSELRSAEAPVPDEATLDGATAAAFDELLRSDLWELLREDGGEARMQLGRRAAALLRTVGAGGGQTGPAAAASSPDAVPRARAAALLRLAADVAARRSAGLSLDPAGEQVAAGPELLLGIAVMDDLAGWLANQGHPLPGGGENGAAEELLAEDDLPAPTPLEESDRAALTSAAAEGACRHVLLSAARAAPSARALLQSEWSRQLAAEMLAYYREWSTYLIGRSPDLVGVAMTLGLVAEGWFLAAWTDGEIADEPWASAAVLGPGLTDALTAGALPELDELLPEGWR